MRAVLALLLAAMLPGTAVAKVRLMRVLDWRTGLPVSYAGAVQQDPEGFLWVQTSGGTFRYDGAEMVRKLPVGVYLVPGSATAGTFLTGRRLDEGMELRELDGTPLTGPDGSVLRPQWAHVTPDGSLWILERHTVRRRGRDGRWLPRVTFPEGDALFVGANSGRNGSLLLPCREAVYRVEPGGHVERVAKMRGALGVLDRADGSTVIGTFVSGGGYVYEVRDGVLREIDRFPTRFMALAERKGALWIAYDSALVRLAPGEPRETITNSDGLPSGGAMIVDREGSLWVATFRGLVQFPEPDSVSWEPEVRVLGRHVVLDRGTVWMSTWAGMFRTRPEAEGWTLTREPRGHIGAPCFDGAGTRWTAILGAFSAIPQDGRERLTPAPGVWDNERCAAAPDGGLWFPTGAGLYRIQPGAGDTPARGVRLRAGRLRGFPPHRLGDGGREDLQCPGGGSGARFRQPGLDLRSRPQIASRPTSSRWTAGPCGPRPSTPACGACAGGAGRRSRLRASCRRGGPPPSRARRGAGSGSWERATSSACVSGWTSREGGKSWSGSVCGRGCPRRASRTQPKPRTARCGRRRI